MSTVLRASPPPQAARPIPRGRPVEGHAPSPLGVSRVALDLRVPTCRRHYPGGPLGSDRSWGGLFQPFPIHPQRRRPSPSDCKVGVHIGRFEACSTFTCVTACRLAASPKRHICLEGSDGFVTSTAAPIASVRRKMHLSLIFLEFLSEMDLEVLGLPSKISAERAVLRVLSEESSRECPMRIAFDPQRRFDCPPVLEVRLNTSCRDEIIPILKGLQHIYSQTELRDELLDAVAQDVNGTSSADLGRPGMTYWSILVLGAVRLGCNFDYDRLQNLAEEHRSLRQVMGIGGWCDDQTFDWRCLRDNICLLSPDTIERVNHLIVAEGHRLVPEAAETVRGDSFVPATNIHYPTDSSLIGDGLRTIVPLAVRLARLLGLGGWRQRKHLLRTVKKQLRAINKIAKGKGRDFPKRLQDGYRTLLDLADRILARALELLDPAVISIAPSAAASRINMLKEKLTDYLNMTIHVCDLARRRVLEGERIDNSEKLFSLFEPHTELIIRGKVPQPLEFGHRVLVIEDGAGFVCHYAILPRGRRTARSWWRR